MKFELEIESNNAAFHPSPDAEIRRLLQSIEPNRPYGKLKDINGNVVGAWSLDNPETVIELYPMSGEILATHASEVTSWDVIVRPDGGDPIEEYEGLSYEEAEDRIDLLSHEYPEARIDTQLEDLLQ